MSNIYVGGSFSGGSLTIQSIVSSGSVTGWNSLVNVDCTSSNIIVTLPSAAINTKGQSITIKKVDNSSNIIRIIGNGTDKIENITGNSIYLYNQGDSVTLCNMNLDSKVISDNRNSIGSSASYLKVTRGTSTTATINTNITFPTVEDSQGNNITYNTSTGVITLKPNIKYRLKCAINMMGFSAIEAYTELKFYNITSSQFVGISGAANAFTRTTNEAKTLETEYTFTPTVETQISPRLTASSNLSTISIAWCEVEEISRANTIINTVDYIFARVSSNVTTINTIIPVATPIAGNIEVLNNMFNLIAGKTYELEAFIEFNGNTGSTWAEYVWTDSSGTYLPTSTTGLSVPVQSTSTDSSIPTKAIITPTQNISVKVMTTGILSGVVGIALTRSYFKITQLGSTAQTSPVMNVDYTNNRVGIGTTPTTTLEVNGFTKLGSTAPAIKQKKLTGTFGGLNTTTVLEHGLIFSKIISFSVIALSNGTAWVDSYGSDPTSPNCYFAWIESTQINVRTGASATYLTSRPFTVLITYEE